MSAEKLAEWLRECLPAFKNAAMVRLNDWRSADATVREARDDLKKAAEWEKALAAHEAEQEQPNLYTSPKLRALIDRVEAEQRAEPSVMVPLSVLVDASQALGNFVSDLGWGADDMQAMDNLDAYIAPHYTETQAEQAVQASMTWKYKGHNSHLNEDDYECSSCKTEWGFSIHTDPDKQKIGCPRCKLPYRK